MRCFLACFGFTKKRKRRKPSNKVLASDQRHGSYQPLDSSVAANLDSLENPICSDSDFRDKPKEGAILKIRKKVSFNLNVQTYEPIPTDYSFLESDEEDETEKGDLFPSFYEGDSAAFSMGSYPSNYRYKNCRDSFDEEDEIPYDEIDLDDDDDNDDEDEDYGDDDLHEQTQEQVSGKFISSCVESQKNGCLTQLSEDKTTNVMPLCASNDREFKSPGSNHGARDRSLYVQSVLKPVENLTQWKAVKARAAAPPKHQRKENIALEKDPSIPFSSKPLSFSISSHSKPLIQEIAVDSSLSNWLVLPKSSTAHCS